MAEETIDIVKKIKEMGEKRNYMVFEDKEKDRVCIKLIKVRKQTFPPKIEPYKECEVCIYDKDKTADINMEILGDDEITVYTGDRGYINIRKIENLLKLEGTINTERLLETLNETL